jgi:hypothetical protein
VLHTCTVLQARDGTMVDSWIAVAYEDPNPRPYIGKIQENGTVKFLKGPLANGSFKWPVSDDIQPTDSVKQHTLCRANIVEGQPSSRYFSLDKAEWKAIIDIYKRLY